MEEGNIKPFVSPQNTTLKNGEFNQFKKDIETIQRSVGGVDIPMVSAPSKEETLLNDLLAIIHRDGGHYTSEHGIEKSTKEDIRRVCFLRNLISNAHDSMELMVRDWAWRHDRDNPGKEYSPELVKAIHTKMSLEKEL